MRMEVPEPVLEDFRGHPEFVGGLVSVMCPPEHVDERIPGDEFLGGQTSGGFFLGHGGFRGVVEVDVGELVRECASSFDLQLVDF